MVFTGYIEKEINFPPSYRYKKNSNSFTDKAKRTPSYTDRILYGGKKLENLEIMSYDCATQVVWSDHKPVFSQALVKAIDFEPEKVRFLLLSLICEKYYDDDGFDNGGGCSLI
jgi:hypothetical protein